MNAMDDFKAREQVSELQVMRSCRLTSSTDDSTSSGPSATMDTPTESMEWTDEKHSLYLKSMEASFVDELYESMEVLGWCPEKKDLSLSKSSKQTRPNNITYPPPSQFEVLRSGCWQKINFDRAESQTAAKKNETSGNESLLSNPWILHFKSAGKTHAAAEQQTASASRENDNSEWKKAMSRWRASGSKQFRGRSNSQAFKIEVSDQNFVDEDNNEGEKTKRAKTRELDPYSGSDQVVPLRKP